MLKKIKFAVIIALTALFIFAAASCSSQAAVEVDQSITPHQVALKAMAELGYTENDLAEVSGTDETEKQKIFEYYSEGSEGYAFDGTLFDIMLGSSSGGSVTLDMLEQYSYVKFDKDLPAPFELVIFKLPKTDGKVDSQLVSNVKKMFNNILSQYKTTFQNYPGDIIGYLDNVEIKQTDNFVYYCIAENSSKVMTVITDFLTGK